MYTYRYTHTYVFTQFRKRALSLLVPLHRRAPESSVWQCLLLASFSVLTSQAPWPPPLCLFKHQSLLHPLNIQFPRRETCWFTICPFFRGRISFWASLYFVLGDPFFLPHHLNSAYVNLLSLPLSPKLSAFPWVASKSNSTFGSLLTAFCKDPVLYLPFLYFFLPVSSNEYQKKQSTLTCWLWPWLNPCEIFTFLKGILWQTPSS